MGVKKLWSREEMRIDVDEESTWTFHVERSPDGKIQWVSFAESSNRISEEAVRAIGAWLMDEVRPAPVRAAVEASRERMLALCSELSNAMCARSPDGGKLVALMEEMRDCIDITLDGKVQQ